MARAILNGQGGIRFKGLNVLIPPTKTDYFYYNVNGRSYYENISTDGAKIQAILGNTAVTLTDNLYWSPAEITEDTTEIIVGAVINGVAREAAIPVTVRTFNSPLDANSWEEIASAAMLGIAPDLWELGDTKTFTDKNGVTRTAQIVGYGHDDLHETDAMYDNADYNGGSNKAAITFRLLDLPPAGIKWSENTTGWRDWRNCDLKTLNGHTDGKIRLPDMWATMPDVLVDKARTVAKKTFVVNSQRPSGGNYSYYKNGSGYWRVETTADLFFLPSYIELFNAANDEGGEEEGFVYEFLADGATPQKVADKLWLRSLHIACAFNYWHVYRTHHILNGGGQTTGVGVEMISPDQNSDYTDNYYQMMFCL